MRTGLNITKSSSYSYEGCGAFSCCTLSINSPRGADNGRAGGLGGAGTKRLAGALGNRGGLPTITPCRMGKVETSCSTVSRSTLRASRPPLAYFRRITRPGPDPTTSPWITASAEPKEARPST